jgi:nucleoside-triphosphatase THEP1
MTDENALDDAPPSLELWLVHGDEAAVAAVRSDASVGTVRREASDACVRKAIGGPPAYSCTMHVLVTGPRDVGKTTFVRRVVDRLEREGLEPVGFYTASADGDWARSTVGADRELVAVSTGERVPFASQRPVFEEHVRVGRFYVAREAIQRGLAFAGRDGDVLVVDELGKLERRGEGFAPVIDRVVAGRNDRSLLAVREDCAEQFRERIGDSSTVTLIRLTAENRDERVAEVVSLLANVSD